MRTALITTATLTLFAATTLFAQPPEGRRGRGGPWGDLPEEQREQIRELSQKSRDQRAEIYKEIGELKKKVGEELVKEKPSQSVLDKLAQQIGDKHVALEKAHTAHLLEVKKVLDEEQFKAWVERMGSMAGRRGRRGRHGEGHDGDDKRPRRGRRGPRGW